MSQRKGVFSLPTPAEDIPLSLPIGNQQRSTTDGVVFALVKQIFHGTGKLESGARQSGRTSIGQGRGSIRYYAGVTFAPAQSSSQAVTKKKSHADYNERADATHHKAIAEGGKAEQRGMRSERRKEKISIPYR
jgi:hypothetical protein